MNALLLPLCLAALTLQEPRGATLVPTTALRRIEHFVLTGPVPDPAAAGDTVPGTTRPGTTLPGANRHGILGVARRVERLRDDGLDLEHATHWFATDTHAVLVEPVQELGPVLVWREWRPLGGRTLVLERDAEHALHSVSWQGGDAVRRTAPPRGALPRATPLRLLEHLRAPGEPPPAVEVYDFLAEGFETLHARTEVALRPGGVPLRLTTLTREGGEPAGRYLLLGPALLAYQVQDGGPVARRCAGVRYDGLLLAHRRPEEPPREGVTKLLPASTGPLR